MESPWAPLRRRAFFILWLAQLGSNVGSWMQTVGAQWYLVEADASPTVIALVQTANMAPALLHPQALDRVIALSGMYPLGDRRSPEDLSGSRILVLNGDHDPMAPLASVNDLVAALERQGADVEQVLRSGGHGIEYTDLAAARDWLNRQV